MGVTVSNEEIKQAIQILSSIDKAKYLRILQQLEKKNKEFVMQLSKWELVMILEKNPNEVKDVIFFLTANNESSHVNTHHLIALLIISRDGELSYQEKLLTLMDNICYQVGIG